MRAERAMSEIGLAAESASAATNDVWVGRTNDVAVAGASRQLDVAWRREALRAVLALTQAPEQFSREVRKQRLARLEPELKVLGLNSRPADRLTQAELKAARARLAKLYHPDYQQQSRPTASYGSAGAADGGPDPVERMKEVNKAYTAVNEVLA